jgi:hypothetical protein
MLKSLLVVAIEMTAIPRRGKLLGTRSACQPIDNVEYIFDTHCICRLGPSREYIGSLSGNPLDARDYAVRSLITEVIATIE